MRKLRDCRKPFAGLLLAWFALASTGVPIALPRSQSPRPRAAAQRFPCENSVCSCSSAEQCWRKCCCRSLAGRIAWARREGVRPPESALDAAEASGISVVDWRPSKRLVARVQGTPPTTAAAAEPATQTCKACCCRRAKAPKQPHPSSRPTAERPTNPGVIAWRALACQGIEQLWLSVAGFPPPAIASVAFFPAVVPALAEPPLLFASRCCSPPQPPPERPSASLTPNGPTPGRHRSASA